MKKLNLTIGERYIAINLMNQIRPPDGTKIKLEHALKIIEKMKVDNDEREKAGFKDLKNGGVQWSDSNYNVSST